MIPLAVPNLNRFAKADIFRSALTSTFVSTCRPVCRALSRRWLQRPQVQKYDGRHLRRQHGAAPALVASGRSHGDLVIAPSFHLHRICCCIAHCGAHPGIFDVAVTAGHWNPALPCLKPLNQTERASDGLSVGGTGRRYSSRAR